MAVDTSKAADKPDLEKIMMLTFWSRGTLKNSKRPCRAVSLKKSGKPELLYCRSVVLPSLEHSSPTSASY